MAIPQNISNLVFASVKHAADPVVVDEQDPDSGAWETNWALAAEKYFSGDDLVSMLLKPSYTKEELDEDCSDGNQQSTITQILTIPT